MTTLFEPVVDLGTGRAVAHEAVTDGSFAAAAGALAAAAGMPAALHVPVLAGEISGTSGGPEALLAAAKAGGRATDRAATRWEAITSLLWLPGRAVCPAAVKRDRPGLPATSDRRVSPR